MLKKKQFFLYGLLCLVLSCSPKISPITATTGIISNSITEIKILCYNIHHANPPSRAGVIDLEAIAKVIREQKPDIVALQEVDVFTNRSGKTINEVEEIAKLSNMPHYYFAKAIDHDAGEYGVAILSRLPMKEMKNTHLPTEEVTKGEHRTLATAVISLPTGKNILFACTHLDAQKSDTNRFLQIKKIVEELQSEKLPVVIAGDFNAVPTSRIIKELDKHFTRSCINNCAFTIPQSNPTNTIDYISYRPIDKFTVTEHKVIDEKYASDHLPVLAVLRIK